MSSSMSSYTVSDKPGRTYHIAVFAVNAVGTGAISNTVVTGEMIYTSIDCILHCMCSLFMSVPLLLTITPTTAIMKSIFVTLGSFIALAFCMMC